MPLTSQEVTVVGTLGGAIVGALATITVTWLNLSRTHQAKIWDLRRQAYGAIISEVSAVQRINDVAEIMLAADPHHYFESKYRDAHATQIARHWKTMTERFASDYLVLSVEFIVLFEDMEKEIGSDDPNESWLDEKEKFIDTVKKARAKFIARARSEVRTSPRLRFWFR